LALQSLLYYSRLEDSEMTEEMLKRPLIWFKGSPMRAEDARVPVLSPTAQFGLNVFEGIRGYSDGCGQVYLFRLDAHLRRIMQSCRLIGIESPYTLNQITEAILDIIQINDMRDDLAVRVTLFVEGEGSWSSCKPVDMFVAPMPKPRIIVSDVSGKTACTSTWRRIDDIMLPPRTKAGANYISGRYAHLEAQSNGANLPILLNLSGKVAEGAGACLMMMRDGILVTPPRTAAILESITRDTLLLLAEETGLATQERDIDRTELYLADEVFLCGSSAELTPLIRIDRLSIGNGLPGPTTRLLSARYFDSADGSTSGHPSWLTPVWK
jgi:branched-chain amino acid aminotransferase